MCASFMCNLSRSLRTEDFKKYTPSDCTEGAFLLCGAVISAGRKHIKKFFSYFIDCFFGLIDHHITKILESMDIYAAGSGIIYW